MADTTTTAYGLTKPEIGASEDTWGDKINADLDTLDSTIDAIGGKTAAGTLKYANSAKLATTSNGVHITNGSSGGSANAAADELIVESSGSGGITISTPSTGVGTIAFGDESVSIQGRIAFSHLSNSMQFYTNNSTERMRIDSSGNVGIGTSSPASQIHAENSSGNCGIRAISSATGTSYINLGDTGDNNDGSIEYNNSSRYMMFQTANAEAMRIDSSGRVGIGTSSPSYPLSLGTTLGRKFAVYDNSATGVASGLGVDLSGDNYELSFWSGNASGSVGQFTWGQMNTTTGAYSEKMKLDASGNLLVGKTTSDFSTVGLEWNNGGQLRNVRNGASVAWFNRLTSDGAIVDFGKDGTTVGSIGVNGSTPYLVRGTLSGVGIAGGGQWVATDASGAGADNVRDIGAATIRWDDVYATNGTIQTSDANEKQQIADLTAAEMDAAKAISKLFKTFKWNDSVAEKGDAARIHTGVIAQEVEAAMTAAGLDAGKYAFFISTTWWESTEVIPAVEAVEAVEAVYEDVIIPAVLDEEGNEIEPERTEQRLVSEAVEAVEAQPERTVTHTYETAEEAPEGAVERTRKGIRYPQLLSFIGAATEQRLASIEARLDALEA